MIPRIEVQTRHYIAIAMISMHDNKLAFSTAKKAIGCRLVRVKLLYI
jgi:hypothetical protein